MKLFLFEPCPSATASEGVCLLARAGSCEENRHLDFAQFAMALEQHPSAATFAATTTWSSVIACHCWSPARRLQRQRMFVCQWPVVANLSA